MVEKVKPQHRDGVREPVDHQEGVAPGHKMTIEDVVRDLRARHPRIKKIELGLSTRGDPPSIHLGNRIIIWPAANWTASMSDGGGWVAAIFESVNAAYSWRGSTSLAEREFIANDRKPIGEKT